MKKILLTSTALVAFAGAAAAEVSLKGSAEMGVSGGDFKVPGDFDNNGDGTLELTDYQSQFFQDIDVTFVLSGETDTGLAFGASVDLDEALKLSDTQSNQGVAIFISGDFGTLTMGDTDGAMDWALTEAGNISNPGTINDAETAHLGYLGSYLDGSYDGQIVRYDYSFGDFGFAFSMEMDDSADEDGDTLDTGWALGAKYNLDIGSGSIAMGIGYQDVADGSIEFEFGPDINLFLGIGDAEAIGVSAVYAGDSGFSIGFEYTSFSGDLQDVDHWSIGGGYTFDAFTVHANYGEFAGDDATISGYGLAVGYDLGGGASIVAGYGSSSIDDDVSGIDEQGLGIWSFGVSMSF